MVENPEAIIHFWQTVATACCTVIVTLIGFWVGVGRKIIGKDEISKMITTESPYTRDREFIMERLSSNKEAYMALSVTLQKVIEVMTELKIQIATLGKTLESLEERMDETESDYQDRHYEERRHKRSKHKPNNLNREHNEEDNEEDNEEGQ